LALVLGAHDGASGVGVALRAGACGVHLQFAYLLKTLA